MTIARKAERKQKRQAKKQRKDSHYKAKKLYENQQKKKKYMPVNVQSARTAIKKEQPGNHSSLLPKRQKKSALQAVKLKDPLLDFAERAIEEGILGSDGEFDEEKMNNIFGDEEEDDEEELTEVEDYELEEEDGEQEFNDIEKLESDEELSSEDNIIDTVEPEEVKRRQKSIETRPDLQPESTKVTAPLIDEKLKRKVQSLLNKLSISNFDSISSLLCALFQEHPRAHLTSVISDFIIKSIKDQMNLLDTFVVTLSGVAAIIGNMTGVDFVAVLVEKSILAFDAFNVDMEEGEKGEVEKRSKLNLISLLCHLYNLQLIGSLLIVDLIDESLSAGMEEIDVEIILRILRVCGAQLRRDESIVLKEVIMKISESSVQSSNNSRIKFMLEVIGDLKNNKQKLVAATNPQVENVKTMIRRQMVSAGANKMEPLRVNINDIRNVKVQGKWWKIGAAWNPLESISKMQHSPDDSKQSTQLAKIAKSHKMNNDIRKQIFQTIMTSQDYIDAYHKLLCLKLNSRQEREIVHVILYCGLQEKRYNPFYTLLASKLLSVHHNFVITFKYFLWDKIRSIEEGDQQWNLKSLVHLSKLYAHLFSTGLLCVSILKNCSFVGLNSEPLILFLQLLIVNIVENCSNAKKLSKIFGEIEVVRHKNLQVQDEEDDGKDSNLVAEEMKVLSSGLRLFIKQYIINESKEFLNPLLTTMTYDNILPLFNHLCSEILN